MKNNKKVIWSNMDLTLEGWEDYIKEEEEYNDVEYTEDEKYEKIYDLNNMYFDDEMDNLGTVNLDGRILVIADLGLWDGRHQGYKIVSSKLSNALRTDCDYAEWYVEDNDLQSKQIHHDGTNYMMYREIKEDRNIENLTEAIYNGETISRQKLSAYTRSLAPKVNAIYGW